MRQGREYWSRHVEAWRRSELSKKAYSEQHGAGTAQPPHQAAAQRRRRAKPYPCTSSRGGIRCRSHPNPCSRLAQVYQAERRPFGIWRDLL